MDPNIQAILLGLLTNGLTSFIAQFGRKDSKLLVATQLSSLLSAHCTSWLDLSCIMSTSYSEC
jgi:hypothetical protein